jgi:predicted Fe-Mo cluster-binding NifX family protein
MIIALPLTEQNEFSPHYGGASHVGCFEVDRDRGVILRQFSLTPPMPEPCQWPDWLHGQGVNLVLAGGIGQRPCQRLLALGVEVVAGAPSATPDELVNALLQGQLTCGTNACEHEHGHHHHGHHHHGHHHEGHDHDGCGCAH